MLDKTKESDMRHFTYMDQKAEWVCKGNDALLERFLTENGVYSHHVSVKICGETLELHFWGGSLAMSADLKRSLKPR